MDYSRVYVTADHGFLFRFTPLDDSYYPADKLPFAVKHSRFALNNDLDNVGALMKVTPYGYSAETSVYAARGEIVLPLPGAGKRYVHGGTSLQETVIPLLCVDYKKKAEIKKVTVSLDGGSEKRIITTANKTVSFFQREAVSELDVSNPTQSRRIPLTVNACFYDAQNDKPVSDMHTLTFNLTDPEERNRVIRQNFTFSNAAIGSGRQVVLKLTEQLTSGTTKTVLSEPFTLKRVIERFLKR